MLDEIAARLYRLMAASQAVGQVNALEADEKLIATAQDVQAACCEALLDAIEQLLTHEVA